MEGLDGSSPQVTSDAWEPFGINRQSLKFAVTPPAWEFHETVRRLFQNRTIIFIPTIRGAAAIFVGIPYAPPALPASRI